MKQQDPASVVRLAFVVLGIVAAAPPQLQAQESLVAARQLYASAEYDNALELLERLSGAGIPEQERQGVELYRALCLLAVGRRTEADRVVESMVSQDPLFRPAGDLPPRVRDVFTSARSRVLPAVIQQDYNEAKAAFDAREFETAASAFTRVLAVLDDPDLAGTATRPPLSDLRTLAAGFRDLSVKSIPPPPPPPPVAPPAPAPPPKPSRAFYTGEDTDVVPPLVIDQDVPPYVGTVPSGAGREGVVEVLIGEDGRVLSAAMVVPMPMATYNQTVLSAAKRWLYRPAMVNGSPVKFRKRVRITVTSASR
jgi:TonB family protein